MKTAFITVRTALLGLVLRVRRGNSLRPHPDVPFGWRAFREEDRPVWIIAPLWLAWPLLLWQRRWTPVAWLNQLGFWCVPEEGGLYRSGHWTWKWWITRFNADFRNNTWWDRLGFWIQWEVIYRFQDDTYRTPAGVWR